MKYVIYSEISSYKYNIYSKYVDIFKNFLIQKRKISLKALMVVLGGFMNRNREEFMENLENLFFSDKYVRGDYFKEINE